MYAYAMRVATRTNIVTSWQLCLQDPTPLYELIGKHPSPNRNTISSTKSVATAFHTHQHHALWKNYNDQLAWWMSENLHQTRSQPVNHLDLANNSKITASIQTPFPQLQPSDNSPHKIRSPLFKVLQRATQHRSQWTAETHLRPNYKPRN